jgi:tetratricopeptide (TPR) repeat protein
MLMLGIAPDSAVQLQQSSESVQQVQSLIEKGDTAGARALLDDLLKRSPREASFYNLDGVLKVQMRDSAGAEASFEKAIELGPRYDGAYLNLGHLYQQEAASVPDARDKAVEIYARLLKIEPDNVQALYQSAMLLMEKGFYSMSLQHLSKLPPSAQGRAQALSVRCGDYAGSGDNQKAEAAAGPMLQAADLKEADVVDLLPLLARHKATSLAIELLEGLRQRNLATAGSLTSLGLLYKQQGRLAEARKTLDEAAQIPPSSAALLIDLARVADGQQDYQEALGYLAHARELEPQNPAIHFFWGMECVKLNLAEEAYESLKKAVALDANNAYYNYALGAVILERDDASEAIQYFQKYCSLKPHDPRGRLALGSAYFISHDDENAKKILISVENNPETAAGAHYYLGRVANHQGDYEQAIEQLHLALKAYPDYADAYAEMGLVHLKQKEYRTSRADLEKALAINPDNYTANLNLMMLYQRTQDPKSDEQARRFEKVRQERAQRVKDFLRTIQVRPE